MVRQPLTPERLRPLAPHETAVIVRGDALTDIAPLAALLEPRPDVHVSVTVCPDITNLDWLAQLPPLRSLAVTGAFSLQDISGLAPHGHSLMSLRLGPSDRSILLTPLAELTQLRQLYLEKRGRLHGLEPALAALGRLRHLTLHSVTLDSTSCLSQLHQLRALALKLGGTRDLSALPALPLLQFVELWQVHALDSLDVLGGCGQLTTLFLQSLGRVTSLPDLSGTRLTHAYLERLSALADLAALRTSSVLEQLWLIDMSHLRVPDLAPLVGHPTLRAATFGLGSSSRNQEAARLLNLAEPDWTPLARHAAGAMGLPDLDPATDS